AEELVEHAILGARVAARVPPEPVGALRDHERLPHALRHVPERAPLILREATRALERAPGASVRGLADPHAEVRVDPRAGVQVRKINLRGTAIEEVRHTDGLEPLVLLQRPVEMPQEVVAVVRVLLPRVLAIEDDRGEIRTAVVRETIARALELPDHVADRVLGTHVAVHESDAVGELAVAEDRGASAEAIRAVEERGLDERADVVTI